MKTFLYDDGSPVEVGDVVVESPSMAMRVITQIMQPGSELAQQVGLEETGGIEYRGDSGAFYVTPYMDEDFEVIHRTRT